MEYIPNSELPHIEKLWNAANCKFDNDWTIKEYRSPPLNVDCVKKKKERLQTEFFEKVWKGKQKYPKPIEKYDSKGNVIIPERGNYFEELAKKKDFGYSEENNQSIKKRHSGHNRSFNEENSIIEVVEPNFDKQKAVLYKEDRETVFDDIILSVKKSEEVFKHKEDLVKKLKEEIEKEKSANIKSLSELIKEKYHNRGSMS